MTGPARRALCSARPERSHTYLWIEVYGLDALCSVAVDHGAEGAVGWINELERISARRGIRELLLHATVYRARLGEPGAAEAARSMAMQIDNPALDRLLDFEALPTR